MLRDAYSTKSCTPNYEPDPTQEPPTDNFMNIARAPLIQGAISQSGTAYSPQAIVRKPRGFAFKLGLHLGCTTPSSKDLLSCLRSISADTINKQIPSLFVLEREVRHDGK
ncbi:Esterase S [Portunus trituberculatus]|uniref:Esterase S n=1 Tax=Portunus trituberculatus TaxID=210409 RepID=A0A5B7DWM7_PORTR|nr:Esterase S [Portunus trituberculatus]